MLSAVDPNPVRRQIAIEEHFTLQQMDQHRWTHRLVNPLDRGEVKAGAPGPQDDGRDDHMDAIQAACLDEPGKRPRATLDEDAGQA